MTDSLDIPSILRETLLLIDDGQLDRARDLIRQVIQADPDNVTAWYLTSFVVDTDKERIRVLEHALKLRPDHALAQRRLADLKGSKPTLHAEASLPPVPEVTQPAPQVIPVQPPPPPAIPPYPPAPPPATGTGIKLRDLILIGVVVAVVLVGGVSFGFYLAGRAGGGDKASEEEPTLVVVSGPTATTVPTAAPDASGLIIPVRFIIADAEYSDALDRVIVAASDPNEVVIYDPNTNTETTIPLPAEPNFAPTAISVSPDGLHAAVGHAGLITYVNLEGGTVLNAIPLPITVADVVLAGNGWAYVSPTDGGDLYGIQLDTGLIELHQGRAIDPGSIYRLHPSGKYLYGADQTVTPDNIERIDISNGFPVYEYGSRQLGRYPMCHNLWLTETGDRIITACGNVFWTNEEESQDMSFFGLMEGMPLIRHAAHSQEARRILAVPEGEIGTENYFGVWHGDTLDFLGVIPIPTMTLQDLPFISNGRWVFWNAAGTQFYVIAQASNEQGLYNNFAFFVGRLAP